MKKRIAAAAAILIIISAITGCGASKFQNVSDTAVTQSTEAASPETADSGEETAPADETEYEDVFASWNEDAPALNTLIDYVEAVTDESSPDYIPAEDRIAVCDMDGTLYGELFPTYLEYLMLEWRVLEDPAFTPDEELIEAAKTVRDHKITHDFPTGFELRHAYAAARAYSGMTLGEFNDFVNQCLLRDVDGFEGMTYGEALYMPMVEVIEYLTDNDFKVYICSGSDRFICRTLFEGIVDIPDEQIIGMDVRLEAVGQQGEDGLDYVYTANDDVIRTDTLLIKNLKMNKVFQIAQEIGRQPVLAFGNSSGDVSMCTYVTSNNAYRSEAFMLIADDDVRDYGNPEKAASLRDKWEGFGWNVISMKDDFATIYGENVVKTGKFTEPSSDEDDKKEVRRLIIDTDTGADDACALIYAAKRDDVQIEGVTVLAGNVDLEQGTQNALMALELAGCDAPVYKGAEHRYGGERIEAVSVFGDDGMGDADLIHPKGHAKEGDAVDFILETVKNNPGEIEIVCTGPATNIAMAIDKDAETMKQVKMIWSLGSTGLGSGNASPVSEFNVYSDADAYKVMLDSGIPLTIIGLDMCDGDAQWTDADFKKIEGKGEIGEFIASSFGKIREFYVNNGSDTVMNCDPVAVMSALVPGFVNESMKCHGSCITDPGEAYGQVIYYRDGFTYDVASNDFDYNVTLVTDVDKKDYFTVFLNVLE